MTSLLANLLTGDVSEELVNAMRAQLQLDFDPEVNPEDEDFEMNYPGNLEAFDPEFLRQAALDVIQGKD